MKYDQTNASVDARALLKEGQVARQLNLSVRTLQNWRLQGRGPAHQKLGASVRYAPEVIEDWVQAQLRTSTSDPGNGEACNIQQLQCSNQNGGDQ